MPLYFQGQATCDHCGKTAPCAIQLCLGDGKFSFEEREYWSMHAAVRGPETWFQNHDGMACSAECRDVLAQARRDSPGDWAPCR
jgi:hypothetical protein